MRKFIFATVAALGIAASLWGMHSENGTPGQSQPMLEIPDLEKEMIQPLDYLPPDLLKDANLALKKLSQQELVALAAYALGQSRKSVEMSRGEYGNLDSVYHYDYNGEHYGIIRNTYSEEGYLMKTESHDIWMYDQEPFDTPVTITEFLYDDQGNTISVKHLVWDYDNQTSEEYYVLYHVEYGYDAQNRQIFYSYIGIDYDDLSPRFVQRWYREYDDDFGIETYMYRENGNNGQWVSNYIYECELLPDGKYDMYYQKYADSEGTWESGFKYDFDTSVNNYYSKIVVDEFDPDTQDWKPSEWREYFFNEDDVYTSLDRHIWQPEEEEYWYLNRGDFAWDDNLWITESIYQSRETEDQEFQNTIRYFYERTTEGFLTYYLYQVWDLDDEQWLNNWQYIYTLNEQNMMILYLSQFWKADPGVWVNDFRSTREFDDMNRITYRFNERWSEEYELWYGTFETFTEYNLMGKQTFYQARQNQDLATQNWVGWGYRLVQGYDHFGFQNNRIWNNWEVYSQEFVWNYTTQSVNDFYGNQKEGKTFWSWINNEEDHYLSEGFITYQVNLQIKGQGEPVEGAQLTIMGQTLTTDQNGNISFTPTLVGSEMNFDYTLTKAGYQTREGTLIIDRNINQVFTLIPEDTQTYKVMFMVKKGENNLEGAQVSLAGYGMQNTCEEGTASFPEVAPEVHLEYSVYYYGMVYEGQFSVSDHDVTIVVDFDLLSSRTIIAETLFRVFPNPATRFVNVDLGEGQNILLEVVDLNGRMVYSNKVAGGTHRIALDGFQKGIYIVRMKNGQFSGVKKLIVY